MGKRARTKERSYRGLIISLIAIGLLVAILTAAMIIFKPKVDIGAFFAPIGYFFSGVFTKVGKWTFVQWLAKLGLMQYVALLVTPAVVGILVGRLIIKYITPVTGLIWILTSIAYGCACYFLAEDVGLIVFCIMLAAADVLILITSMRLGGNSFAKSLLICTKQLVVLVPAALILGAIYLFAGSGAANTLITVAQYLFLATSLLFQIWFSDPIRSL